MPTSAVYNKAMLSSVFDQEGDLNVAANKFIKRLEKTIQKILEKLE